MTEPAADLAVRLRELKDRSGLSFGALAQKLHLGTSTLHRYCAGEAVPAEFAILDRFGRTCGASPEELLALHRAWLAADARRVRGADAPGAPPAPVTPPAAVLTAPTELELPPDPSPPPTRRRGRLLLTVAKGVLVLAASGIALAGALDDDGSTDPVTSAPPVAPLTVNVRAEVWESGCDYTYFVDRSPAEVPEPPVEADARTWSDDLAAVDARRTIVEVTVAGTAAEPVVLQGLTVRMGERREPLDWNVYAMSLGCGGALTPASFEIDLDRTRPVARPRSGFDGERPLPAVTFPFRVSSTEPVVLRVTASTKTCDCDWSLDLAWTSGGSTGTTTIADGGRDFRTSGSTAKAYGYRGGGWFR